MTDSDRGVSIAYRLYRWRWWVTAILVGAHIALGASGGVTDPISWTMFVLMLLLVWAPALARWFRAARAARTAFQEGYSDVRSG